MGMSTMGSGKITVEVDGESIRISKRDINIRDIGNKTKNVGMEKKKLPVIPMRESLMKIRKRD